MNQSFTRTHSHLKTLSTDVRFSLQTTVESVKEKLWKKCGASVESMTLELHDDVGSRIRRLDDRYRLHIVDHDPSSVTKGGWLEDTSLLEKYTISDEDYNKLDGTIREFKESMASQNPSEPKITDNYMEELCTKIKVVDRCEVEPGAKRGVVKFVGGGTSLAPGFWVGVQYDEPLGKHDGLKGHVTLNVPHYMVQWLGLTKSALVIILVVNNIYFLAIILR